MKRKTRWTIIAALALLAVLSVVFSRSPADPKSAAEATVRRLVLADYRGDSGHLVFQAARFGESSWLVMVGRKGLPVRGDSYLVDPRGSASPMSDASLSAVMREEHFPFADDPDHKQFIDRFLLVRFGELQARLSSAADIPGHAKQPLPEALAVDIRPQFKTPDGTLVFYTYQEIAGIVRKNEFKYDKDGKFQSASCTEVGRNIGDAVFYE